ncbi:short chain dehydrogenase reductase [Xylariaceae sp. FL0255]|nr:short chain dehydrogenase reductase [Xylariaceae sp. FL0255]
MASIKIDESSLPSFHGKVAIITGGSSGIGLAAARIFISKGATVHNIDVKEPSTDEKVDELPNLYFHQSDVSNWVDLRSTFDAIGPVDFVFANAGVTERPNFFEDTFDDAGQLAEPSRELMNVNLNGVLFTVKLAWNSMRRHKKQGSIVITTSASGYAPEQSLPVYSGGKLALVGLVRALRSVIISDGITINAVAPAATMTGLLPPHLAAPIIAQGLPVSTSHFVGLALMHAATASQDRRVEVYGKEEENSKWRRERWNGRIIVTLGDSYTEVEEPMADLRRFWFGSGNLHMTRLQQAATDFRE